MDDATASLVLNLCLDDITEVEGCPKGKQVDNQQSDDEVSFNLLRAELQQATQVLSDRQIACSLALAVRCDAVIISRMQEEEYVALQDHQLVRKLGGVPATGLQISEGIKDKNTDEDLTNTSVELNVINRDCYFYKGAAVTTPPHRRPPLRVTILPRPQILYLKSLAWFMKTRSIFSTYCKLHALITSVGVASEA